MNTKFGGSAIWVLRHSTWGFVLTCQCLWLVPVSACCVVLGEGAQALHLSHVGRAAEWLCSTWMGLGDAGGYSRSLDPEGTLVRATATAQQAAACIVGAQDQGCHSRAHSFRRDPLQSHLPAAEARVGGARATVQVRAAGCDEGMDPQTAAAATADGGGCRSTVCEVLLHM